VFKLCTKFEQNRIINLAHFHCPIFRVEALSADGSHGFVDQTSLNLGIWDRGIIVTRRVCFRVQISRFISTCIAGGSNASGVKAGIRISHK